MTLQTWAWPTLVIVAAAYWVILFTAWYLYTTRPSTQARARERAFSHHSIDPATGEATVVFERAINVGRLTLIVVAPPVLLTLGWLMARAS